MIRIKNFDFRQRLMIGAGTSTIATMDSLEEVATHLETMKPIDRHFCWIYDHAKLRRIEGSMFRCAQYDGDVDGSLNWKEW